jgi:SAM-dependent methyltransferase
MIPQPIRFDDGEAYERLMGAWSRHVGDAFLDWLSPATGQRWIDVGCGNGAFTERLVARLAPAETQGIDPSEALLAYARARPGAAGAMFQQGDAMALPFAADRFDAAAMALTIAFVPDPARAIAEMARVVRPGGLVATYMWDHPGGGHPFEPILKEMRAMGLTPTRPPNADASGMEALRALWADANLEQIETRVIPAWRDFNSANDFWDLNANAGPLRAVLSQMEPAAIAELRDRVLASVPIDAQGRITVRTWANAIQGRVPQAE